jgi:anti-sigma factor RsiW
MVKDMNTIHCEGISDLLEPFMDGELAEPEREVVERHVRECGHCRQQLDELRELGGKLRRLAPYKAPAAFVDRLRKSLEQAESHDAGRSAWQRWTLPVATHVAAVLVGLALGAWIIFAAAERMNLSNELVAAHVRSLMSGSPIDVASSDTHQVGPWFAGKIDFAPRVVDLTTQGFPLIGGRVDYFQGRTVAVMVFRRHAHTINVFVMPHTAALGGGIDWSRDGYNIVHWNDGEFDSWAISDLNAQELDAFAKLLRGS